MMVTIYEFYSKLKKHIGQGGAVFRKFCGLSSSAPYCNAYVCYGFYENGVAGLYYGGKKVTYCPTSIKWCKANLAQVPMYLAMKDDPIYFDWNNNNVPDHIGFVKEPISTDKIATHEGNTNGGIVAEKTRPARYVLGIFRPHFKPSSLPTGNECKTDGVFGYDSIYFLQKALGIKADGILGKDTVKALQKKAGCDADGAWGKSTSKAVQKMIGTTVDGAFGKNSVIAFQKWINKQNGSSPTPSKKSYTRTKMKNIAHARADFDKKAGDSSGKEVCKTAFTYNSSSNSVYNWTYIFRPKDIDKAEKAASMIEKGCANNNIGYCSSGETKYGKDKAMTKLAKAVDYDLSKISVKCGCSCGDIVCLANHYAGLSTCYIGSAVPLAKSLKANSNFTCISYKKGTQLYRGDVLITAHSSGKKNHVVMCV